MIVQTGNISNSCVQLELNRSSGSSSKLFWTVYLDTLTCIQLVNACIRSYDESLATGEATIVVVQAMLPAGEWQVEPTLRIETVR